MLTTTDHFKSYYKTNVNIGNSLLVHKQIGRNK